jgi:RNA recognition motif-containing protein
MKLYVGNLPREMNDAQLNELVAPFGKPDSATVVLDRQTRENRGFGFVEFSNAAEAQAAITGLNGKEISGKALVVNEARPQKRM